MLTFLFHTDCFSLFSGTRHIFKPFQLFWYSIVLLPVCFVFYFVFLFCFEFLQEPHFHLIYSSFILIRSKIHYCISYWLPLYANFLILICSYIFTYFFTSFQFWHRLLVFTAPWIRAHRRQISSRPEARTHVGSEWLCFVCVY